MAPQRFALASAPARLTLTVSRVRMARWREAAGAADESVEAWAYERLQQFGGWRWTSNYLKAGAHVVEAAGRLVAGGSGASHDDVGPGWVRLLRALGAEHHEWCVELGRLAERVAMEGHDDGGEPAMLARLSAVLVDDDAEALSVSVEPEEMEDFRGQASDWGFDEVDEWAAAAADVMLDHEAAPFGVRDCVLGTRDDAAAAAVLDGLLEELSLWEDADELTRPFLGEHLERTARFARLQLAGRGAR